MMKKNDLVKVVIEDIGSDGAGIGKADGFTLFVKDTVIGDVAEVRIMKLKKTYGYARLERLLAASADRVEQRCPVARQCGGCQLQAMSYEKQLEFKQKKVRNNLLRIGGLESDSYVEEPICGMENPFGYRNKAQFPVQRAKNGEIVTGFYAAHTHSVIANEDCALGVPENERILKAVLSWMRECDVEPYDETTGQGLVRHVLIRCGFATKELMVCLVVNGTHIPQKDRLVNALRRISGMTSITANINRERTNVILGAEMLQIWGKPYIEDCIGDVRYRISPMSFYQVNPAQTEKLYGKVMEYAGLSGQETVWDLYCGIGTISLFLAKKAKLVCGVEVVSQAVADARANAKLNGIENVRFYEGKAEEVLPEKLAGGMTADIIVVDPPRKGCDEALLDTIVKMSPERVVYVSCDSATLARDVKYLGERGYRVERVQAVDMFPMTVGVETVCLLSKLNQQTFRY